MKKLIFILFASCLSLAVYSQTNTFPTTGNVGIGTTTPAYKLDVNGLINSNNDIVSTNGTVGAMLSTTNSYSGGVVGTKTNHPFFIYTNSTPKMSINATGYVGIGIISPLNKLHIDAGNATANYAQFTIGTTTGQTATDGTLFGVDATGNTVVKQQENLPMLFYTNNTEKVRLLSSGNLGIGTTTPNNKLEINQGTAGNSGLRFTQLNSTSATTTGNGKMLSVNATGDVILVDGGSSSSQWTTSSSNIFSNNTGNVGIGTSTPSTKLDVNGALKAASAGFNSMSSSSIETLDIMFAGSQNVIHTEDGSDLIFNPNAGNVGIGTTTPSNKLEINQGTAGNSGLRFTQLNSASTTTTGNGKMLSVNATGDVILVDASVSNTGNFSTNLLIQKHNPVISLDGYPADIEAINFSEDNGDLQNQLASDDGYFKLKTAKDIIFSTFNNETVRIKSNGNVGIGTTTPSSKLTLQSTANGSLLSAQSSLTGNNMIFEVTQENSDGFLYLRSANNIINTRLSGYASSPSYFLSNVGIGTTDPQYTLAVKGTIGCGEVRVVDVINWADFVFKPDYKLRKLTEVEQFIKANNHLPEIPTEKEVKENGISIGEMNAKLLQKVEELTLYMIEQQKQMADQQKQLNELKEQNSQLVKEIQSIKK